MRRSFTLFWLLVSMLLASCEVKMPEDIIKPDRMEALLYDYHLVQSMSSEYSSYDYKEKLYFDYVFNKNGVTKEQFEHSMGWYNRYPKHLRRIYTNLEARLDAEVEALNSMGAYQEQGVTLDLAFLDTDTVELWSGAHNRLFCSNIFDSYMAFGFEVTEDSMFVSGDSISFSFNVLFVNEGREEIAQNAHAAILLNYSDGSSDDYGINVESQGKYVLALKRNYDAKIKSLSGFVYYSDDDSLSKSKMLLSDISVKKIRPPKTVITKTEE